MKTQAFNPFLPSYEYIPDGEPYVFGNRVYIYGSHDAFNGSDYCVNNYVCWSASVENLGDWKYEGVIYDKQKEKTTFFNLIRAYTGKETESIYTPASARPPDAGNQGEPTMTESKDPLSWNWKQICLQSKQNQKLSRLAS